jgi:hypothetical protein
MVSSHNDDFISSASIIKKCKMHTKSEITFVIVWKKEDVLINQLDRMLWVDDNKKFNEQATYKTI